MSLEITAKHLESISVSYCAFDTYRIAVVRTMDEHIGDLYEAWCKEGLDAASEADRRAFDDWFAARPATGNLCAAPDCDFSFSPPRSAARCGLRLRPGFRRASPFDASTAPRREVRTEPPAKGVRGMSSPRPTCMPGS